MDLKDLRSEIDVVDKQIVELFEKRMDIASQVADYKISTGKKVFDKEREEVKLQAVQDMTASDFNKVGARFGQEPKSFGVDNVSGSDLYVLAEIFVDVLKRAALPFGKAFRGVQAQNVGSGL